MQGGEDNQKPRGVRGDDKYLSLSLREFASARPRVLGSVRLATGNKRQNSSECVRPLQARLLLVRLLQLLLLLLLENKKSVIERGGKESLLCYSH